MRKELWAEGENEDKRHVICFKGQISKQARYIQGTVFGSFDVVCENASSIPIFPIFSIQRNLHYPDPNASNIEL